MSVWTELEREAHRVVLDLVQRKQPLEEPERIASRILQARRLGQPARRAG